TVLVADDAAHAQALSGANPEGVDLLITDVFLPDGSGLDVVARIAGEQPGLRVLYMSGFTARVAAGHVRIPSTASYLEKPILPGRLIRRVRQVLDAPAPDVR
ncbi:MAG: response regulator, partial [Deltaproteobacteria bacterium]|nr:response regulator [Deltaproteobacteria bacterium]